MNNVTTAIFEVESEAYQAFSEVKANYATNDYVVSQISLVKKENGMITMQEAFDSGLSTSDDTLTGSLIGMLIGVWGGPLGLLLGGTGGALAGSIVDAKDAGQSLSMMEVVGNKLLDGETALVMLASEERESALDTLLGKYKTTIIRRDAAVVSEEVERAMELQKELERDARQKLLESKKSEHKAEIESRRKKIQADFDSMKSKLGLS